MTRPTRSLALFVVFTGAAFVAAPFLPDAALWSLAGLGLAVLAVSLAAGRHFFLGRVAMRDGRLDAAFTHFERFREEQLGVGWRAKVAFLFAGIYTPDGVALALNNLGAVRLDQRRLDDAEPLFVEALARDARYAMPHVNLAIIAAMRADAPRAEAESQAARALGFRRRGFQAAVRAALASANTSAGAALEGPKPAQR